MLLVVLLLVGCGEGDAEPEDGSGAEGGDEDGGAVASGYGPDCADSVVIYDPCDCTAVAVNWEEPLAAMDAAGASPGMVWLAFTELSGEDFAAAACAGTLQQSDLSGYMEMPDANAHEALADFSGRVGQSVGVFVADSDGELWGYLFGEIAPEGQDYELIVPAVE